MSGMILALAIWVVLRALDKSRPEVPVPCMHCFSMIIWDGRRFIHHDTGEPAALDEPSLYLPQFDEAPMTHIATPAT